MADEDFAEEDTSSSLAPPKKPRNGEGILRSKSDLNRETTKVE